MIYYYVKNYVFFFFFKREEDRDILVALKTQGASAKTFAALSSKMGKSQAQVFKKKFFLYLLTNYI